MRQLAGRASHSLDHIDSGKKEAPSDKIGRGLVVSLR